jgi:subtilase family protein
MRITLIGKALIRSGRVAAAPAAVFALMSFAFAATFAWHPGRPLPATEMVMHAGGRGVPVEDGDVRPAADRRADPRLRGDRYGNVKGWLENKGGGRPATIPEGVRTIDVQEGRVFVEIPVESLPKLAALRLEFEPVEDADLLNVGSATFDVRDGEPPIPPEWLAGAERAARRPYVVKFDAPIREAWLADLQAAGAEIVQYQPHFGYLLLVPSGFERTIRGRAHVAFGGEYHADYKARAELKAKAAADQGISVRIVTFDLPGAQQRIDHLVNGGARLETTSVGAATSQWTRLRDFVLRDVRSRDLPAILRDPAVYWVEEWSPPQVEDERASQIIAGNYSLGVPATGYHAWLAALGADGTGVTVAVADTGFDTGIAATIHEDLRNRTAFATAICANSRDQNGHGTNTAAIALGDARLPTGTGLVDGSGFFWGTGGAPGGSLYVQRALSTGTDCTALAGQPNVLTADAFTVGGARIGSHSFQDGLTPGNSYTSTCALWDARTRDADTGVAGNQPYLVVFSAGNSGPAAGSLTSPHAAKNIISVGATENYRPGQCPGVAGCGGAADDIDVLIDFSSRGPTVDNRIKPDVSAPGHAITGARSSVATYDCFCDPGGGGGCCQSTGVDGANKYSAYSGTSQAAPRVAGAAAIVFDWFKDHFGAFPSPAMAKAILINGAVDMKIADIPNFNEGWGRINLSSSLMSPVGALYTDQTAVLGATGDPAAYILNGVIQDPTRPVTVTVDWTDPAGAVSCNPCLVNDLDLLVTQGATTWRGNNFTAGFSNTSATADTRNNVEEVKLPAGTLTCSTVQLKVRAQALNGDGVPGNADTTDQDFALVAANLGASGVPAVDVASSALSGGCDSDAFLDRGETATLSVGIRNAGCADASGVAATLSVVSAPAGATVTVSPTGAAAIGSIATGATVPHDWQVSLANGASSFCAGKVVLQLAITDAAAHSWTRTMEVTLDADSLSPTTNTDPATVDNSSAKSAEWSLRSCRTTSAPTSWHMGQADCTGIVRDASSQDLVFTYNLPAGALLGTLSFQHAFSGYRNADFTLTDSVQIDVDPENDGSFVNLDTWQQGIDNPTVMTLAGPYDLTPFNATHGPVVKFRFRFQSAANWVGGANTAPGWDVDDIVLTYSTVNCDTGSCTTCAAPSGLTNNGATDPNACQHSGVLVSWSQDPGAWGDSSGTRGYVVLRDNVAIASGPCSGTLAYGTTSCLDSTAAPETAATYKVRYVNGCALAAATAGVSASDVALTPPADVTNSMLVTLSGGNLALTWDPVPGATRYNVYMGTLGTWTPAIFTATGLDGPNSCFEPSNSATFAAPASDVYFLVAADNVCWESSLGASTPSTPRPYASPACSPH